MQESWFDMAVIGTNGHVLNAAALANPDPKTLFCDRCGCPALCSSPPAPLPFGVSSMSQAC
jgi:hypothetical protein